MKRFICLMLAGLLMVSLAACGSTESEAGSAEQETVQEVQQEEVDATPSKEQFKAAYDLTMASITLVSAYSADVISKNLDVWDRVGADSVAYCIDRIRSYEVNGDEDKSTIMMVCVAYGYDQDIKGQKEIALTLADKYGESYKALLSAIDDAEESFKSLKSDYGDYYDLSDIKDYYIEVSSFSDLAINLKGSYISYSSDASDYLNNIDRYQKAAELAY